jgi:hypothetical protein
MSMVIVPEHGNLFRLNVRGILKKSEFDRCQERLAAEIIRHGSVRLLFVLEAFDGWEPNATWNDLTFYAKYGDCIDRIAIVGPQQWRSEALLFASAELRRASVEFFAAAPDAVSRALAWLDTVERVAETPLLKGPE